MRKKYKKQLKVFPEMIPPLNWMEAYKDIFTPKEISLLKRKIKTLKSSLKGRPVGKAIREVMKELEARGLGEISPHFFVSDTWAYYEGIGLISIPFWALDEEVFIIRQKIINGPNPKTYRHGKSIKDTEQQKKIIRHEIGHLIADRYEIRDTHEFRQLFGNPYKPYRVDKYTADLNSTAFVDNVGDKYGQSHPDEDFAETFAVWLDPSSGWAVSYKQKTKSLAKLQYIEKLMTDQLHINESKKTNTQGRPIDSLSSQGVKPFEHTVSEDMLYQISYSGSVGDDRKLLEYFDDIILRLHSKK
jgi:Putative zinc-binding metallo-peptidase